MFGVGGTLKTLNNYLLIDLNVPFQSRKKIWSSQFDGHSKKGILESLLFFSLGSRIGKDGGRLVVREKERNRGKLNPSKHLYRIFIY